MECVIAGVPPAPPGVTAGGADAGSPGSNAPFAEMLGRLGSDAADSDGRSVKSPEEQESAPAWQTFSAWPLPAVQELSQDLSNDVPSAAPQAPTGGASRVPVQTPVQTEPVPELTNSSSQVELASALLPEAAEAAGTPEVADATDSTDTASDAGEPASSERTSSRGAFAGGQSPQDGGDSSGADPEGQTGSARQEHGRRVFAAAASVEPGREIAGSSSHPPDVGAAAAGLSPGSLRPAGVGLAPSIMAAKSVEESPIVPQLVQAMRTQFRDGCGEARIRLHPEHLGEVRIDIKIDGDRVSALLYVERPDVRHAIEAQSESLKLNLAAQGLILERLTVEDDNRVGDDRRNADDPEHGRHQPPRERKSRKRQPDREFTLAGDHL